MPPHQVLNLSEALYYRKPTLMVPVHVEQEFNAYDASFSGLGISAKEFKLNKLIEYIPKYVPDEHFREWVHQAEARFIEEICR